MTRILVVDDDAVNREVLFEVFDGGEYELAEASSGEEALEIIAAWRPDIVLLDIMMPGIDGYETCRRIRSDSGLADVKILLVSAKAMPSERIEGYQAGADDYVTKPFDMDELRAKVAVFGRLHRAEQLDSLKDELLSLVAHEIRTPMTGIKPAAELLLARESMTEAEQDEFAEMILRSSEQLLQTADRALLLASLRSGRTEPQLEDTELRDWLRSCLSTTADAIRLVEGAPVRAPIDRELLGHAVRILVEELRCPGTPLGQGAVHVVAEPGRVRLHFGGMDAGSGPGEGQALQPLAPLGPGALQPENMALLLAQAIAETHGGSLAFAKGTGGTPHYALDLTRAPA